MSSLSQPGSPQTVVGGMNDNTDYTTTASEGEMPHEHLHVSAADIQSMSDSGQGAMSRMADTLESINAGIQQIITIFSENNRSTTDETEGEIGSYHTEEGSGNGDQEVCEAINQPLYAELDERNYAVLKERSWREMPLITKIKECNYRQFKEHIRTQPKHVIEVLMAGSNIEDEITAWRNRFQVAEEPVPATIDEEEACSEHTEQKWIHRVRVNSTFVIKILYKMGSDDGANMNATSADEAHTCLRPFALLLHYHQAMRYELQRLDQQHEEANDKASENSERGTEAQPTPQHLAELRCYIDFVERCLIPELDQYRSPKQPFDVTRKVRFEDILYLFYPGQLIFVQKSDRSEATPSRGVSIFQNIRRIYRINHPRHRAGINDEHFSSDGGLDCEGCSWSFKCYNIEFDGDLYGRHTETLSLRRWKGEKVVMELEFLPLCYMKDHEELLQKSVTDGKALVNLYMQRHGFYSGWTLINGPFGEALHDADNEKITRSAHIESDILVDYHETFNTWPFWKPVFSETDIDKPDSAMRYVWRAQSCLEWGDPEDNGQRTEVPDRIVISDCAAFIEYKDYTGKDAYFQAPNPAILAEEDYALLPRRFFAYSVWERKFVQLDIRALDRRQQQENEKAFDSLQIDDNHKCLIRSLVQSHFKKKEAERKENIEMETQDIIRGKGKGVIILLHGVPGVGKTATAEAVAQRWNKPLFPITCGDLGIDAEGVERSLNGIFRLAHLWDCILLLDEADVFITQREKRDLARNALVSVFLRMLEYYNGILFLTTNRPGVLDESVKSRVHLVLRYDHLTEDQTVKVFELNIEKLREAEKKQRVDPAHPKLYIKKNEIIRFARDHYQRYANKEGMGRWNGREIRNAFLVASSLAHYGDGEQETQEEGGEEMQKQLGAREFEMVEKTTLLYDEYRFKIYKRTDDERAFEREERDHDS